jgi:hypothetical protein
MLSSSPSEKAKSRRIKDKESTTGSTPPTTKRVSARPRKPTGKAKEIEGQENDALSHGHPSAPSPSSANASKNGKSANCPTLIGTAGKGENPRIHKRTASGNMKKRVEVKGGPTPESVSKKSEVLWEQLEKGNIPSAQSAVLGFGRGKGSNETVGSRPGYPSTNVVSSPPHSAVSNFGKEYISTLLLSHLMHLVHSMTLTHYKYTNSYFTHRIPQQCR